MQNRTDSDHQQTHIDECFYYTSGCSTVLKLVCSKGLDQTVHMSSLSRALLYIYVLIYIGVQADLDLKLHEWSFNMEFMK